ncbi:MAG TPA: Rrf2 family transcriptional regulator [Terriglobales bacterium]|nr:Rrf2 family transcriptional regulator [Terriglobales bacterium]
MLSITAQYAIRALVILAGYPNGHSVLGRDLARDGRIPRNYLAKILLALKNAGILGTARGSRGGYWLVKRPEALMLVDVVRIFDQIADPPPCLMGKHDHCTKTEPCTAHGHWHEMRDSYLHFLQTTTLADLSAVPAGEAGPIKTAL